MLGNDRVYKALVHKLTTVQTYRLPQTETELTTRLLTVTGKANQKTVRLYKSALLMLNCIHPDANRYYLDAFWNHRFPGNESHRDRNHRVAESVAMCMRAGIECRPYLLPRLQNQQITKLIPDSPCFYLSKDLKRIGDREMNKTMFTRMVGTVYVGNKSYVVYNTRDSVMKWNGKGEFKTIHSVTDISRLNAGFDALPSAILFGESESVALNTLVESDKSKRPEFRFDIIYRNIYFIPMNEFGIRQLSILSIPDWKEKLLDLIFEPEVRTYNRGLFEYDALINGTYVFSHLDGDLARLVRFKEAIINQNGKYEVLCYPYQMHFIREYFGGLVTIKTIDMGAIEAELNSKRRNLLEQ